MSGCSRYPILLFLLLIVIAIISVNISAVKVNKKSEEFVKLFNGGVDRRSRDSSSSSEEDLPLTKFNLNGIAEFFHHFKGSQRCGQLGRRILKDTQRLFDSAADHHPLHRHHRRGPRHISHHLSQLYSRYSTDCCDDDDWMDICWVPWWIPIQLVPRWCCPPNSGLDLWTAAAAE